jgi:hypothetical protein
MKKKKVLYVLKVFLYSYRTVPIQEQPRKDLDGNATNPETIQKHQKNGKSLRKWKIQLGHDETVPQN